MKCAIMQPTYLPWSGYFNLIASVDCFVFLDDVQFQRRSWQSRNRICRNGEADMLSVSTMKADRDTAIRDIRLSYAGDWRERHSRLLREAYGRAACGGEVCALVDSVLGKSELRMLADLNIALVKAICHYLGLTTRFLRASELGCGGHRSEHLASICERIGATQYLSPVGSADYLSEDEFEALCDASLVFQSYHPAEYPQVGAAEFISHLSVIDMMANVEVEQCRELLK